MEAFGIEFHNTDHLEQEEKTGGWKLCRFPKDVTKNLGTEKNQKGKIRACHSQGCELRFSVDGSRFELILSAAEADAELLIYKGDMLYDSRILKAGIISTVCVEEPQIFSEIEQKYLRRKQFSPAIWRIQFGMHSFVCFHSLNAYGKAYRPPRPEEKPLVKWTAYGSSITSGSQTGIYSNCFINQAAVHLGYDVSNKGIAGSCLCEAVVADYLAELDADVLSLELGINMLSLFDEKELECRFHTFLEKVKKSRANQIFIINLFPCKNFWLKDQSSTLYRRSVFFREMAVREMRAVNDKRFYLIPGEQVQKDSSYLSTDLLHPSDNGHIKMGVNLAQWMRLPEIIHNKENKEEKQESGGYTYGIF